jgi:hypothetical protein
MSFFRINPDTQDFFRELYKWVIPILAFLILAFSVFLENELNNYQDNDSIAIDQVNDLFLKQDSVSKEQFLLIKQNVYVGSDPKGEPHIIYEIALGLLIFFSTIVLTGSFLNFNWGILKTMDFFRQEVSDIVYEDDRYLSWHQDIKQLWVNVSERIHKNKFPQISDEIQQSILKYYFPSDNYYAEEFSIDIRYKHIGGYLIEVKEVIDQVIQTQECDSGFEKVKLSQWNSIVLNGANDEKCKLSIDEIEFHSTRLKSNVKFKPNDSYYNGKLRSKGDFKIMLNRQIDSQRDGTLGSLLCAAEYQVPCKDTVRIIRTFTSVHDIRCNVLKRQTFNKITRKCSVRFWLNKDFDFEFGELGTTEDFAEKKNLENNKCREFVNQSIIMRYQGFVIGSQLLKNIS